MNDVLANTQARIIEAARDLVVNWKQGGNTLVSFLALCEYIERLESFDDNQKLEVSSITL